MSCQWPRVSLASSGLPSCQCDDRPGWQSAAAEPGAFTKLHHSISSVTEWSLAADRDRHGRTPTDPRPPARPPGPGTRRTRQAVTVTVHVDTQTTTQVGRRNWPPGTPGYSVELRNIPLNAGAPAVSSKQGGKNGRFKKILLEMDLVTKLIWVTHLCSIVQADPTLFASDTPSNNYIFPVFLDQALYFNVTGECFCV
jgi:hypothetical protein